MRRMNGWIIGRLPELMVSTFPGRLRRWRYLHEMDCHPSSRAAHTVPTCFEKWNHEKVVPSSFVHSLWRANVFPTLRSVGPTMPKNGSTPSEHSGRSTFRQSLRANLVARVEVSAEGCRGYQPHPTRHSLPRGRASWAGASDCGVVQRKQTGPIPSATQAKFE